MLTLESMLRVEKLEQSYKDSPRNHPKYFEMLVSKMEEIDPEAEISHRIAGKYQKKEA